MPLPVIANALRIVVQGRSAAGTVWQNTWHAMNVSASTWDAAKIAAFHPIFNKIYIGPAVGAGLPWVPRMAAPASIDTIRYTILDGSTAPTVISTSLTGSGGGDALPPGVAAVVTLRTALIGRQNRGRIYFPATTESDNGSTGLISSVVTTGLVAQVNGVNGNLITAGFQLAVGSYGPYKPTSGGTPHVTPVVSVDMNNVWDSQRRRKS